MCGEKKFAGAQIVEIFFADGVPQTMNLLAYKKSFVVPW